jgi:hypothetical protein
MPTRGRRCQRKVERWARDVKTRRDGRFIFYSLADEHVRVLLDATLTHFDTQHA